MLGGENGLKRVIGSDAWRGRESSSLSAGDQESGGIGVAALLVEISADELEVLVSLQARIPITYNVRKEACRARSASGKTLGSIKWTPILNRE